MKKYIVLAIVLLWASSAMAGVFDPEKPVVNNNSATAISGASAFSNAAAVNSNEIKNSNSNANFNAVTVDPKMTNSNTNITAPVNTNNAGQTISPTQSVTFVTPDQKTSPSGLPYATQQYPPNVQAPGVVTEQPQTQALVYGADKAGWGNANPRPWNMQSAWSRDEWPTNIIKPVPDKVKGIAWKERVYYDGSDAKKLKATKTLTIYKGQDGMLKYSKTKPQTVARRTFYATEPNVMLWELQDLAMSWAVSIGASGLKVNSEFYTLKNTQKGQGLTVGAVASVLTSILSNASVVGPGLWYNAQAFDGTTDVYPTLDVEAVE